ncbi:MAG: carbohydrate ABC transporter permease [Ruminiclostridium sp.]
MKTVSTTSNKIKGIIAIVITVAGAFFMLLPFLWMFSTSLRHASESMKLPPQFFPTDFVYQNYLQVLNSKIPFAKLFLNSLKVVVIVTGVQLITCSTAAYSFARLKFPGRNVIFGILLTTMMVPIQVTIIPIFIGMSKLRLVDTHWSITLPYLTSAFGIFLMRQFFAALPKELEDSGKIDGAGPLATFLFIIMPQAGAPLSALGIITFNSCWNNYFTPLIFINSWEKMTLPLGIAALRGYMGSGNLSAVMAGVTLAIIPVLVIFLFAQRFFIEGIAMSGIKE